MRTSVVLKVRPAHATRLTRLPSTPDALKLAFSCIGLSLFPPKRKRQKGPMYNVMQRMG